MERILTHIEQVLKRESPKNDLALAPEQIPLTDQQRILNIDIRDLLAGRVGVYDDRETPPR